MNKVQVRNQLSILADDRFAENPGTVGNLRRLLTEPEVITVVLSVCAEGAADQDQIHKRLVAGLQDCALIRAFYGKKILHSLATVVWIFATLNDDRAVEEVNV
jgi:hypothetical protein